MSWFILMDWTTSILEYEIVISDGQPRTIFCAQMQLPQDCHITLTAPVAIRAILFLQL